MIPLAISREKWEKELTKEKDVHERILDMILKNEWKEVIEHLTEDMDPWDIDLTLLNQRFLKYLEEIKNKDLKIPAKMILIAALIYRMKSEFLKNEEDEEENETEEEFVEINEEALNNLLNKKEEKIKVIELPPIILPTKKPIKRKVTIYELINALEKALKSRRRSIKNEEFSFELNEFDIRELIEHTYDKILKIFNISEKALFSQLLEQNDIIEKIHTFHSLLYLTYEERIKCIQHHPFDDIIILPYTDNSDNTNNKRENNV